MLLLLVLLQQEESIPKAHREAYQAAVRDCDTAALLLEENPTRALELLNGILGNSKIEKRERRLRIELHQTEWSRWYDFFPYQFRGRARLKIAEKETRESAARTVERAIQDFEESKRLGLGSSDEYLKQARRKLEELRRTEPDRESGLEGRWKELLAARKFRSAQGCIESGGALSSVERARYRRETEKACLETQQRIAEEFLRSLPNVRDPESLPRLPEQTFLDPKECVMPLALYDWCVAAWGLFERLRGGEEILPALLDHAVAAAPFALEGERRGLACVEAVAYEIVRRRFRSLVETARNAPSATRSVQRQEAQARWSDWERFEVRWAKAVQGTVALPAGSRLEALKALCDRFPVDFEGSARVAADLQGSVCAENPDEALEEVERRLQKPLEEWDRYGIESRKEIVTYRVVAAALRGFFRKKSVERLVEELGHLREKVKEVGGTLAVPEYGSKVAEVLERLAK